LSRPEVAPFLIIQGQRYKALKEGRKVVIPILTPHGHVTTNLETA
jgi:hypothetical protein